jgi:hypothetical protein
MDGMLKYGLEPKLWVVREHRERPPAIAAE